MKTRTRTPAPQTLLTQVDGRKAGKEKPSKNKPTAVLYVPSTKGGLLTKMLKENEEEMIRITQFRRKV